MKKIINILLSFFMTVVIFACALSVTGCLATSSPFIKAVVSISDYKQNIEPEISDSLKSVAIPSGLPEDFFNDKIKSEYIDRIINESIEAAINKQDYTMPLDELEQLIYADIVAYANEHGTELDEDATQMLKNTAELAATYYKNYTYNIYYRALKHIGGIYKKLALASAVLIVVLVVMIYLLNKKQELCYSLCGGGVMLLLPLIFIFNGSAYKWGIVSKGLLTFVNSYITTVLVLIILFGVISLTVGILKAIKIEKNKKERV